MWLLHGRVEGYEVACDCMHTYGHLKGGNIICCAVIYGGSVDWDNWMYIPPGYVQVWLSNSVKPESETLAYIMPSNPRVCGAAVMSHGVEYRVL